MVWIPLINCTYSHRDMQGILLLMPKMDTMAIYSNHSAIYLPIISSPERKAGTHMNRDRQLIVNLEVTVPRLILPIPSLDLDATSAQAEQVRLSSIDAHEPSARAQSEQQPTSIGEVTTSATYAAQQEPFRLFAIKHIQTHGQALQLQILRLWKRRDQ